MFEMSNENLDVAAKKIWDCWNAGKKIDELPKNLKPKSKVDAYLVQRKVVQKSGGHQVGWKIAATSKSGQRHIGVDGPLAGALLKSKIKKNGAKINLKANLLRVAELEFAFQLSTDIPPKDSKYNKNEISQKINTLIPTMEIPDSRFNHFLSGGQEQIIADNACAGFLILGEPIETNGEELNLVNHEVLAYQDNQLTPTKGIGSNVLGDPLLALTWIANELIAHDNFLRKNDIVTTGTCITPIQLIDTTELTGDFGVYGKVSTKFTDY